MILLIALLCCGKKPSVQADSDSDGDGFAIPEDCDDNEISVNPDAVERCDGVDDDCNGLVDDNPADGLVWHQDGDSDGYGDPVVTTVACEQPVGYVDDTTDCDDDNANVHPDATEVCDSRDNNCNGSVDEDPTGAPTWYGDADSDGYGDASDTMSACSQPGGYVVEGTDCDDLDATIYPGAPELCNGVDDDCDDSVDEDPTDGYTWYVDDDGDGFGDESAPILSCTEESGTIAEGGDCDDSNDTVYPGADEACGDGRVNDCEGDANTAATICGGWGNPVDAATSEGLSLVASDDAWLGSTLAGKINLGTSSGGEPVAAVLVGAFAQGGTGAVYLQRFGSGGAIGTTELISGTREGQGLGSEVAGISDLDGDGMDEILLAETAADERGQGRIYLLPGMARTPGLDDALAVWEGVDDGELAGTEALASLGDVDGDGKADFIAGARYGSLGATYAGQAYIISSSVTGTHALSEASARLYASSGFGYAATRVTGPGDLDGDGVDDAVVDGSVDDAAWIVLGPFSGDLDLAADADAQVLDTTGITMTDVAGGDLDGDGITDLVLSSVNDSTGAERAGAVFVHRGPFSGDFELTDASATILGETAEGYLGGEIAVLDDIDGDDQADLLVGTGTTLIREDSVSALGGRGQAFVFSGIGTTSGTILESDADLSFFNDDSGASFGMDVASAGDLNGDGRTDLLLAGPEAAGGGGMGDAWILSSDIAY